jgi:hypothetical protein
MKVIVATGHHCDSLDTLFSYLVSAGVKTAIPAEKTPITTIDVWHERLIAACGDTRKQKEIIPGKAWEQAAGEIFLANWEYPLWGWANSRSVWLLDFWRKLDSDIRFVLVHYPPEQVLAQAITASAGSAPDIAHVISGWLASEGEMLRFYNRNRERCVLVDAADAILHPREFVLKCGDALGITIDADALPTSEAYGGRSRLVTLLARRAMRACPEAEELRREIEASLTWQVPTARASLPDELSLDGLVSELRTLFSVRDEQTGLAEERLEEIRRLTEQQTEQEQRFEAENERLREESAKQLEAIRQELSQENELLLLQLHQVQEELEQQFLRHNEQAQLATERQAQIEALSHARDEQAKLAAGRQSQIEQLTQARDGQARLATERQAQIEALVKSRDEQAGLAEERLGEIRKLTEQQAEREQRFEAENRRLREESAKQLEAVQRESNQENELLLLQLHQVQEELEHYFLQYQDAQKQVAEHEVRWNRMLQRHPDYCDWTAIEVAAQDDSEPRPMIRWRIRGFTVGGRFIPNFEVSAVIRDGRPALVFHRSEGHDTEAPFMRWPAGEAGRENLILQPQGGHADRGFPFELTTSDWRFVRLLCSTLADFSCMPLPAQDSTERLDVSFWLPHLNTLSGQLDRLPSVWRHDGVKLKHEQVNPDYEHLWLTVDNAEFGNRRWPVFEFRLSAALVRPDRFSIHPKLEFPKPDTGSLQFENWYAESSDDFGPKFELRFDLDASIMDIAVWNTLTRNDKAQFLSIARAIPKLLSDLENKGVSISRPWNDWQRLAAGMIDVMGQRAGEEGIDIDLWRTGNRNFSTDEPRRKTHVRKTG